jgi:hypothetical protein
MTKFMQRKCLKVMVDRFGQFLKADETPGVLKLILQMINNAFSVNPRDIRLFVPLVSDLWDVVRRMSDRRLSAPLISAMLTFLTYTARRHSTTRNQTMCMRRVMEVSFKNNVPRTILDQILQWAVGKRKPSTPVDVIESEAFGLLLLVSSKAEHFEPVVETLMDLDIFSTAQCSRHHDASIDVCLLQQVPHAVSADRAKSILSLFSLIARAKSSVSVVQRFVSLFCRIEHGLLSPYHLLVLRCLVDLLTSAEKGQETIMPFMAENGFRVQGLQAEQLNGGFTVFFSLREACGLEGYESHLINFRDSKGGRFSIVLTWNALRFEFDEERIEREVITNSNRQYSLAISFEPIPNQTSFRIGIVTSEGRCPDVPGSVFTFAPGALRCTISGTTAKSRIPEKPTVFRWAGLFAPFLARL